MKTSIKFAAILLFISTSQAWAGTWYPDNNMYNWPGFETVHQDVVGAPNILGADFVYNGHYLTQISVSYKFDKIESVTRNRKTSYNYQAFAPGDWFFSIDGDDDWEYVLTTASDSRTKDTLTDLKNVRNDQNWLLYDLQSNPLDYDNEASYILAGEDLYPDGWGGRDGHPALANLDAYSGITPANISFSGWEEDWENGRRYDYPLRNSTYTVTWDLTAFGSNGIFLGDQGGMLTYGFSLTCANDVLYGKAPIPTPEPGTALLLGLGLLGLGAISRRRNS